MNIRELLEHAALRLLVSQPDSARLDAEILLCHALEVSRAFVYANAEWEPSIRRQQEFLRMVNERDHGTPVAYLTGTRSFWSLELTVNPDVLIPRNETELLVETALGLFPSGPVQRVADLGTGSGALALALAKERPDWEVHATDLSAPALEVAKENARRNELDRVQFHLGSWAEPLSGKFDLIVSNPPYVANDDLHLLQGDCRFEPRMALSPGIDVLSAFTDITSQSRSILKSGGWLLFEHGWDQGPAVSAILISAGYQEVNNLRDLGGVDRVCYGKAR